MPLVLIGEDGLTVSRDARTLAVMKNGNGVGLAIVAMVITVINGCYMNQCATNVKEGETPVPTVSIQPVGNPEPVSINTPEAARPLPTASETDTCNQQDKDNLREKGTK